MGILFSVKWGYPILQKIKYPFEHDKKKRNMMENKIELHVVFGTGPVGRAVMQALVEKGKNVRMVNRSGQGQFPAGVEIVAGDAADPAVTRKLCQGAAVVYNCTNPPYTQWPQLFPPLQAGVMAGAAAAGAKLVVMENVYMYGPTHGQPLTEGLPYAAATRKGITRAHMAEELLEAHASGKVRVAIGRASDFFGPGVRDSAAGERLFGPAVSGKTIQLLGNPDLLHTYTYIPDIGRGLVILGERDEALGQAWHLPSPRTITTRAFIELVCKEAGTTPHIQAAPRLLIQGLGLFNPLMRELAEMLYEFEEPFVLDSSKFEKAFGYGATPLEEAVQVTTRAEMQRAATR
jgi:nucleoside-diphosphate-sugar epimerase